MPKIPTRATGYQRHKLEWKDCTRCLLHEGRSNVVLLRGKVPCQALFIGEAPGASEDVLGRPFVGPAGALLDHILQHTVELHGVTYALTNLVGCIPLGEDGNKTKEPPEEAIEACSPRLIDIVQLCKPEMIISVGQLAHKYVLKLKLAGLEIRLGKITHPAAILRTDISQRGLVIQQCIVDINNLIDDDIPF